MLQRPQLQELEKRLKEKRRFIQVIFGPRQVGKTTMAGQLVKEMKIPNLFVSADAIPVSDTAWIAQQWENARLQLTQHKAKEFLLVIDEIQKIDNWSEMIKLQWDTDSRNDIPIKVVLLGSSR